MSPGIGTLKLESATEPSHNSELKRVVPGIAASGFVFDRIQAGFNLGSIPVAEPEGLASVASAPRQHFGPVNDAGYVGTRESQMFPRTTPKGIVGLPSLVCMILIP